MSYQGNCLSEMAIGHLIQERQEAGLDISQAFTVGESDLAGSAVPSRILLRKGYGCFGVRQPLEATVVEIEQAVVLAAEAVGNWAREGIEPSMNRYN